MQLKTILNFVERQPGFVYGPVRWLRNERGSGIELELIPRRNSRPICSGCGSRCAGYDRMESRRFEFVPFAKKFGEALDKVRAGEARQLEADGYEPILKHSRCCLLKRKENLTSKQTVKLKELLKYNLRSVKAYLMRADFDRFWSYRSPAWARKFLRDWCARASRCRIEPMQAMAKTLLRHEDLLLNWFVANGLSSGVVEGSNNKAKLTMRKAYGFKEFETIETALYHQLGHLPEPESTHRFCRRGVK